MSEFQDFLAAQKAEGDYDSEGCFTVDFSSAADRLASFRLPSENHFLLKTVQLASRLGADAMRVKLESFRSSVHFRAPHAQGVNNTEAITRAFMAPLDVKDPVLADLAAALWGCLGDSTLEIAWSISEGYKGRRIFIKDHKLRVEDFQIQVPLAAGELPCAFTLSVIRRKTWRFWATARRNAEAARLLLEQCALGRVILFLDGRQLERAGSSYLTNHRQVKSYGEPPRARPYHTVLYELAPERQGFQLGRPSLSQYLVRDGHFNIWTSATRVNNSLKPDGISTPAWMLQFREEGKNVSIRLVGKQVRCRLILAYDQQAAQHEEDFRLTLVRHSVLLGRATPQSPAFDTKPWYGCHLILEDDTLETDLTGFQIIENERLAQLLQSLVPTVELAKAFLEQGRSLAVGL